MFEKIVWVKAKQNTINSYNSQTEFQQKLRSV